ncbi:Hypothetical protein NTJ_02496 [Nesidiocoris tenuis]|uniref:Uncharacterized protein n=1 Tax=Nesidiocoris tenuis TaxID=355587 RepID=A0ABN7ACB6_9HEMI|nr:Hypothetical protein NTJ_02496 [Nesidiocoris tenuis]
MVRGGYFPALARPVDWAAASILMPHVVRAPSFKNVRERQRAEEDMRDRAFEGEGIIWYERADARHVVCGGSSERYEASPCVLPRMPPASELRVGKVSARTLIRSGRTILAEY